MHWHIGKGIEVRKNGDTMPEPTAEMILFPSGYDLLQIAATQPRNWGKLETLALSGILMAIDLTQAFERLSATAIRAQNELAWLNQVGDSMLNVLSSLQIDEVAGRIMGAVKDLLDVEETSIMLKDFESGDLIFWRYTPPERDLTVRLKMGQGIAGWVLANEKPAIVNDVRSDPRWDASTDAAAGFTTHSILALPVFLDGAIVGVVEAVNKKIGDFTTADQGLLETLAKWAAIAIGNANTYDEFKRTTDRLAEAKQQTAMAQTVLNLAHKINNAVGAVRVWSMEGLKAIEEGRSDPDEMHGFLVNVLANAEETLSMVRRIRSATELQAGDIRKVDVVKVLESALGAARIASTVAVERQFEPNCPLIGADAERLVEVFVNLLDNAGDALGNTGRVTVTCRGTANQGVEVLIEDNAGGIPEHLHGHVFDPFVTTKEDGLGLGLWMVKLYVELINGTINIRTVTGQGTRFRIMLPPWGESQA
jgi:signal transduction histidine kinase